MNTLKLGDAAALADASYTPQRITSPKIDFSSKHPDVQAHLLSNGVLLLPGSNSVRDYLRYNLRPLRLGNTRLKLDDGGKEKGASGTFWHQGFLAYAREVYDWLDTNNIKPTAIVGHSLGAAAAQILCRSYGVPAIGFDAPRPKFSRSNIKHDKLCLLINRFDDPVPRLPPRFHHMAKPRILKPTRGSLFGSHKMRSYRPMLEGAVDAGAIPAQWP